MTHGSKRLPYMKLWVADLFESENWAGRSLVEKGAFAELLMQSWAHDGLPNDEERIRRLAGAEREEWLALSDWLLGLFPVAEDGRRRNARQELERAQARDASEAGRKAARARWDAPACANGYASAMPSTDAVVMPSPEPHRHQNTPSLRSGARPRKKAVGPHPEATQLWERIWEETRGEPYAHQGPKDGTAISKVLRYAKNDLGLVEARMRRLLENPPDAWYAQNASPCLLASKWNELGVEILNVLSFEERRSKAQDDLLDRRIRGDER